jgi:hypothetical protein
MSLALKKNDMELLLYVLINMCTNIIGPGGNLDIPQPNKSIPILKWFEPNSSFSNIANTKQGQLVAPEECILRYFTPYWEPFKDLVWELLRATFPNSMSFASEPQITHETMPSLLDFLLPRAQPPGQVIDTVVNALQASKQTRFCITRTKPWSLHGRTFHRGSILAIDPSHSETGGSLRFATRLCLSFAYLRHSFRPALCCRFY